MAPQQSLDAGSIDSIDSDMISEAEAMDEFLELPIAFQNFNELKYKVDEIDSTDASTSTITFTNKEIRERDLRHAEELQRHAEELENLYNRLEESNRKHTEEIRSMERWFHDESQEREALLEQALSYAEKLEAKLQKRDATIEELRIENLEKDKTIRKLQPKTGDKPLWPRASPGDCWMPPRILSGRSASPPKPFAWDSNLANREESDGFLKRQQWFRKPNHKNCSSPKKSSSLWHRIGVVSEALETQKPIHTPVSDGPALSRNRRREHIWDQILHNV